MGKQLAYCYSKSNSVLHIRETLAGCYHSGMIGVSEFRRENLALLIEKYSNGMQREFADKTGLAPAHVSQIVTCVRNMGDAIARRIETSLRLPPGSVDYPPDYFYAHVTGKLKPGTRIIASAEVMEGEEMDTTAIEHAENSNVSNLICLEANKNAGTVDIPLIELKDLVQFEAFLQFSKGKTVTVTRSEIENAGERVFAAAYHGTNMSGRVPSGALLIVDPDRQPEHGDIIVACSTPSAPAQVKRLEIDGPHKYLVNDPDRADWIKLTDDRQIIGVVLRFSVEVKNDFR